MADLEIYLYGATSAEGKYTFVEELLKRALDGIGCTTHFCASHSSDRRTFFRVQRRLGADIILSDRIYFEDRTHLSEYSQVVGNL
jgi:hypothetical protein